MRVRLTILIIPVCVYCASSGTAANAATITLATLEDTILTNDPPRTTWNWGAHPRIWAGFFGNVDRSLVRFNISPLGAYSEINSLIFRITVEDVAAGDTTISLHQVAETNGDWVAGTTQYEHQAGSSSWDFKVTGDPGGTPWDGGPGLGTTGYGASLATALIPLDTPTGTLVDFVINNPAVATSVIDSLLSGANEGFLLKSQNEAVPGDVAFFQFSAQLIVDFDEPSPVPEPASVVMLSVAALGLFGHTLSRHRKAR